ncbi:MAG: hypothetical protein QME87_10160 [Bacillota bacterium]|nr:hypothetical protein [Bacillota bacterium]
MDLDVLLRISRAILVGAALWALFAGFRAKDPQRRLELLLLAIFAAVVAK